MVLTIHVSFYMFFFKNHRVRIYPDVFCISGAVDGVTSIPNAYVCKQKKVVHVCTRLRSDMLAKYTYIIIYNVYYNHMYT